MKRINNEDGSYILTADVGRDLIVRDIDGVETTRTKEVSISAMGTLNTWYEVAEIVPEVEVVL